MSSKYVYDAANRVFRPVRVERVEHPRECWACAEPIGGRPPLRCPGCGEHLPLAPGVRHV